MLLTKGYLFSKCLLFLLILQHSKLHISTKLLPLLHKRKSTFLLHQCRPVWIKAFFEFHPLPSLCFSDWTGNALRKKEKKNNDEKYERCKVECQVLDWQETDPPTQNLPHTHILGLRANASIRGDAVRRGGGGWKRNWVWDRKSQYSNGKMIEKEKIWMEVFFLHSGHAVSKISFISKQMNYK